MKVNYSFQKAERERAKLAKKEAKRRDSERRQAEANNPAPPAEGDVAQPAEEG